MSPARCDVITVAEELDAQGGGGISAEGISGLGEWVTPDARDQRHRRGLAQQRLKGP